MKTTRRNFVRTTGAGAAAIATAPASIAASLPRAGDAVSDLLLNSVHAWITDDDRRLSPAADLLSTSDYDSPATQTICIDQNRRFQNILGFGAAFTDGACYLLNQLSVSDRESLFHHLFHPSEMGLNVCRMCIGASDNSVSLYSFDDGQPDPELKRFSIEHDREYILPILRQARNINPEIFLFASPWSPPGWMKDNGSMLGGCMRHTHMPAYANYFVKFIQAYEAEGVTVHAVTVQNEVDADQQGLMPACFWPQDYEADFVREHLGPTFEKSGVKSKIWIIDHNYNLWGRAICELETPNVRKYTNSVAWHGYTGQPEWMMRVQNAFPDVEMHWTEGSPDHDDPEYLKCWALWAQKFSRILVNGCRSITGWSFATDERGRPNVGPYPLGGLLTIDSKTKSIYHSGQFWAMEHYSRFIQRGAFRIDAQCSTEQLCCSAFKNPDGSLVAVITNPGQAKHCNFEVQNQSAKLFLTGNSVVTLLRKAAE
jgi:glucosylceramidase